VGVLSGGEAKRVALARGLAPAPEVLLLDEPLSGLDDELRYRLLRDLRSILDSTGITALVVTHDEEESELLASSVVRLG
jgi:thiamine transport system ATP-binding protein